MIDLKGRCWSMCRWETDRFDDLGASSIGMADVSRVQIGFRGFHSSEWSWGPMMTSCSFPIDGWSYDPMDDVGHSRPGDSSWISEPSPPTGDCDRPRFPLPSQRFFSGFGRSPTSVMAGPLGAADRDQSSSPSDRWDDLGLGNQGVSGRAGPSMSWLRPPV